MLRMALICALTLACIGAGAPALAAEPEPRAAPPAKAPLAIPPPPAIPAPKAAPLPKTTAPTATAPTATTPTAPPTTGVAAAGDRINAAIIVRELKDLGYPATVDLDDSGDPRVNMKIDDYNWSIYFYDCAPGDRDTRGCVSYQFYSGYTMDKPVDPSVINRWNTDHRYARAYTYVQRNGSHSARIEIDVRSAGTGANPGPTFRAYFAIMKDKASQFRKVIGFQ